MMCDLASKHRWTLADEMALEALPEETKRLVARALKCRDTGAGVEIVNGKAVTLEQAYDEGWDDAIDSVELSLSRGTARNPYAPRVAKVRAA